jgi:hypothetical protein
MVGADLSSAEIFVLADNEELTKTVRDRLVELLMVAA